MIGSATEPMEDHNKKWVGTTEENCKKMIERAKTRSPMVKFMIEKLEEVIITDYHQPPPFNNERILHSSTLDDQIHHTM